MNTRVLVAALLGGLAVFFWGMLSHEALGLGEMGISTLPNEAAVLETFKANVEENGLYLFPDVRDRKDWEAAYANSPTGVLAISPPGTPLAFGRRLGVEFATDVVGAILAILLLGGVAAPSLGSASSRVLTGAALGGFASISIDASYANWYGFPTTYLVGQFLDQTLGWAIGIFVAGWWLGRKS